MKKLLLIAWVISSSAILYGQQADRLPAPSDVKLEFRTKGDQHQFHLVELIPIQYSYSAEIPDKYFLVSENDKLIGGRGLEIECSPEAQNIKTLPVFFRGDNFRKMLYSCPGYGFGGQASGSCRDCSGGYSLKSVPIHFEISLNHYVRFSKAGKYECMASSAEVTAAPRDEKVRPALLIKSNPLELTIMDDPAWAHGTVLSLNEAYQKSCRNDVVKQNRTLPCFDIAERITDIDTADSLALEVKLFDGKTHDWDNGFWDAIQRTSYPKDAVKLMTDRMQGPDFEVSNAILEAFTIGALKVDSPNAFETNSPGDYHAQAVEKLRQYVRLLGNSLAKKNADVLLESVKTYRSFARNDYCEGSPLIPKSEQDAILTTAGMTGKIGN